MRDVISMFDQTIDAGLKRRILIELGEQRGEPLEGKIFNLLEGMFKRDTAVELDAHYLVAEVDVDLERMLKHLELAKKPKGSLFLHGAGPEGITLELSGGEAVRLERFVMP
jgi:hypothetical protein